MADITTRNRGRTAAPWAGGLALALLAGTALYLGAARTVADDEQTRFDHLARTSRLQLDGAVRSYADVVRGLAGLFQANGGAVTRLQFHRYVETLGVADHYPALESVNFAAYVDGGARDAFVAAVRADRSVAPGGYPDFTIRPDVRRPSHTVLTYLEPWLPEKAGVDLSDGAPAVAQTLARARDSGRIAASGKPVVVERPVRHLGLGLRMPVYRTAGLPPDVETRRAAYAGSVGIGFSIPALVRGALPGGDAPVALQLYAAADNRAAGPLRVNGADTLLYDGVDRALAADDDVLDTVLPVRFDDNLWKARFVARRADLAGDFGRVFPWLAGAGGFGATLLMYALFVNLVRARRAAADQRRLPDRVPTNADAGAPAADEVEAAGPDAAPAPAPLDRGVAARPGALAGCTILLVEDNAFNQLVARELLEDAGATVIVAGDGAEALARLEERRVDCVLMDVRMPVMDGYEATRRIRADPRLAGLKVIAMTANAGVEDRSRCLAAGMDDILAKPDAPDLLVATIARALGHGVQLERRKRDSLAEPGARRQDRQA